MKEKLIGPTLHRALAGVDVLDSEKRTARLSFSSDSPYLRSSWFDEPWLETLGHDSGEVEMARLDGGACPLLWGHDSYDRENHIGVIEKAWLKDGKGYADVRLSARADLNDLWADVVGGIVRNVSVGYKIHERILTKAAKSGPSEYRVTRWEPVEISLVSVPADPGVGVGRSADPAIRFTITNLEQRSMPSETTETPVLTPAAPAVTVAGAEQIRAAQVAERERSKNIRSLVTGAGLPPAFADAQIESGAEMPAVREAVLAELIRVRPQTPQEPRIQSGEDQADKIREAGASWMLHRANQTIPAGALNGNPCRGMTMLDMARSCLERAGVRTAGMLGRELATRAVQHTTSDFPIIFQNVMNKTLLAAYTAIPDVWRKFCRVGSLSDFRPHYRYRPGSFGNLATVAEGGAYTYGAMSDAVRESITGATKGKLLNLSRQMIINDDMGAFANAATEMGRGAARTVEVDVFALLASNPTMGDTGALFNATAETTAGGHANLNASGAAPTVSGFDAVRQAMGSHLNVGGTDYTGVLPKIWLGPLALGSTAREINGMQFNDESQKLQNRPNVVRGLFSEVVDTPRLSGNIWYAFADPAEEPVIEVGFLDGEQAPYTEIQNGFETDGVTWKIRLDYGVAAVGWRGAYKVTY